jgi:putative membrane protein
MLSTATRAGLFCGQIRRLRSACGNRGAGVVERPMQQSVQRRIIFEVTVIEDPYKEFTREEMILRDWLALDRTVFANKRTFLAYGRTAVALIALGIALVKLIDHQLVEIGGYFLMGFGVLVFFVGLQEFLRNTARFKQLARKEKAIEDALRREASADQAASNEPLTGLTEQRRLG